jgi:hypothetical protein
MAVPVYLYGQVSLTWDNNSSPRTAKDTISPAYDILTMDYIHPKRVICRDARTSSGIIYRLFLKEIEPISQLILAYSEDEGETWDEILVEVNAGAMSGYYASMAIDSVGKVYVLYFLDSIGTRTINLKVYEDFTAIAYEIVAAEAGIIYLRSQTTPLVTVDKDDLVWCFYQTIEGVEEPFDYKLKYRTYDGNLGVENIIKEETSDFTTEDVESDRNGNIFVIFNEIVSDKVQPGIIEAKTTRETYIHDAESSEKFWCSSIAIDDNDKIHVVYIGPVSDYFTEEDIYHASLDFTGVIDPPYDNITSYGITQDVGGTQGCCPVISVDKSGIMHVLYQHFEIDVTNIYKSTGVMDGGESWFSIPLDSGGKYPVIIHNQFPVT